MGSGNEIKPNDISFKAIKEDDTMMYEELTLKEYESKIINHFMCNAIAYYRLGICSSQNRQLSR